MDVTLANMPSGKAGIVTGLQGGAGFVRHLESLGIRPGKKITKLNSVFKRGPVIVDIDRAQVAVGYGMAQKITLRLEEG